MADNTTATTTTIQRTLALTPEVEEELVRVVDGDSQAEIKPDSLARKDGEHFLRFFLRVLFIILVIPMIVILVL